MGTVFHLVRHGAHPLQGRVLVGRTPGVELSPEGREQAASVAEALAGRLVAAVVSSPMQRARETASVIANRLPVDVQIEAGLDEIDFGEWTGRDFATLAGDPAWNAWNRHRRVARCPCGESMGEAQARAVAVTAALEAAHPEGEVVLVSHQDVLKAVLAHALGLSLDHLERFRFDPGHRSVLVVGAGWRVVEAVNLPPG